jgi:hypothetical protein
MRLAWLAALLAAPAALAAGQRLPEFTHSAALALEGAGAIYALELPAEVHRGIARRDLGDLRVVNGAGEAVPHALVRQSRQEKRAAPALPLAYFALRGVPGRPIENVAVRVERRPDGTVKALVATRDRKTSARKIVGYLIDASALSSALRELRFDWQAGADGTALEARLEASDDLRVWRDVGSGPLLVLRHGEALLERRALAFAPQRAKYFRLSWRGAQPELELTGAQGLPVEETADKPRLWLRAEGFAGAKPGEYVFELPRSIAVDRVRFELPQDNTVARASLFVQQRPTGPERAIASAVLYRMTHAGQKLVNPDLEIAPTAEPRWVVRIDARGGGLGSGLPAMQAGWLPYRLVFVARGEAPFRIVFGNEDAAPAAIAVQSLVPGYAPDKPLPALEARLGEITKRELAKPTGPEALSAYVESLDRKKLWLWSSLVAAVLVIVAMAWRLIRQMPGPGESRNPRPPYQSR